MKGLVLARRGLIVALVVAFAVFAFLNSVTPGPGRVAAQEEQPTPTPIPTPTAVPTLGVTLERGLPPGGVVGPGDTLTYTVTVSNLSGQATGPVEVAVRFSGALVSGVINISDGGTQTAVGEVVWTFPDGFEAGEPPRKLSFQATLVSSFPPGRSTLSADALVRAGGVEVARSSTPPLEIVGPTLQVDEVRVELLDDANVSGRLDAGDTVRIIVLYSNVGSGTSQKPTIISDYPEELVTEIVANPDGGLDDGRAIAWTVDAVPADGQSRQVQFDMRLIDKFPAGVTSVPLQTEIRSGGEVRHEFPLDISVSGASIVLEDAGCPFTLDNDSDDRADPNDEVQCQITLRNRGNLGATPAVVTVIYDAAVLKVLEAPEAAGKPGEIGPGTITWKELEIGAGEGLPLTFSARVLEVAEGQVDTTVVAKIERPDAAPVEVQIGVSLDEGEAVSAESEIVQILQPEQGTGTLREKPVAVSLLLAGFLILSLVTIGILTWRVLGSLEEDDRPGFLHTVYETVLLTLVLFSVMLLGLQNAIARDAVNSIIGGIVGYVAGRVASRMGRPSVPPQQEPPDETSRTGGTGLMPSP